MLPEDTSPRDPGPAQVYRKGERVEWVNMQGRWNPGYATGRQDARGIEVTAYPPPGSGGTIRTVFFHPSGVRAYKL